MSMCHVVYLTLTYPIIPNVYVEIEIFESSNDFDQSMILIKLLEIELKFFMEHQTPSKGNHALIQIIPFNQ